MQYSVPAAYKVGDNTMKKNVIRIRSSGFGERKFLFCQRNNSRSDKEEA
jgi:hypothetical protein